MKNKLIDIIKVPLPGRENYTRTKWRFWPSEASCIKPNGEIIGRCLRMSFYNWNNIPESNPVNDRVKLLGEIGNFVEYKTRKELFKKKIYSMEENERKKRKFRVTLVDDIVLSGEVDIITTQEREHCGIEVKSYSNSTHYILNRPKEPHLLQTFLYAVYYKPTQPYFLIKYMPSMISKYATRVVYHRIDWIDIDGEIYPVINGGIDKSIKLSNIIRRYKEAKYYVNNKKLPRREFKRSSTPCKQCPFRDFCKNDKEGSTIE